MRAKGLCRLVLFKMNGSVNKDKQPMHTNI